MVEINRRFGPNGWLCTHYMRKYCIVRQNQVTAYVIEHIWCLSQARINWEGCSRKGIRNKTGQDDGGGSLISLDEVAPIQIVDVSASVFFPCTIKSRRRFLLAPAHPGSPGKRAIKWLCVCVLYCETKSCHCTLVHNFAKTWPTF